MKNIILTISILIIYALYLTCSNPARNNPNNIVNDETVSGHGGASFWGGGASGSPAGGNSPYNDNEGYDARVYGTGGGGADHGGAGTILGGSGKSGIVVVEEYA